MLELLSNIDLKYYCKLFKINLLDILPKDLFKTIKPKLGCYIINIDDSIGQGTHWTGLIIKPNCVIYYDSFGLSMPQEIFEFIYRYNRNIKIIYNIDQIQDIKSILCGWFVLVFLYHFDVFYKKNNNIGFLLNQYNMMFNKFNKKLNDKKLQIIIKVILKNILL